MDYYLINGTSQGGQVNKAMIMVKKEIILIALRTDMRKGMKQSTIINNEEFSRDLQNH